MARITYILLFIFLSINAVAQNADMAARSKFIKAVFTDSRGTRLPYRLYVPTEEPTADAQDVGKYPSAREKKYPVILFLHGAGERGNDNEANLSYIDKVWAAERFQREHPCYVIVPQCAENYRWCETDWTWAYHTMPETISVYLGAANELLDSIAALPEADSNRLYVTGMSMGGFGTWDIITRYPDKFAAAMPICGGADEKLACRIKNVPVRTFHGSADRLVKVSRSRNITNAIKACGGTKIEYTEFQGMGHLIWDKVYGNYQNLEWLMSFSKN